MNPFRWMRRHSKAVKETSFEFARERTEEYMEHTWRMAGILMWLTLLAGIMGGIMIGSQTSMSGFVIGVITVALAALIPVIIWAGRRPVSKDFLSRVKERRTL